MGFSLSRACPAPYLKAEETPAPAPVEADLRIGLAKRIHSLTTIELKVLHCYVEMGCGWKGTLRACGLRDRDELRAVFGSIKKKLGANPEDIRREKEARAAS